MERQHCCLHQWSKKPVRQYRGCGCSCNHQLSESLSKTEWCNLSYRTASPETWQWGPRWGGRSARSNRSFSFGLRSFSGGCLPNFFVVIIIIVEGCQLELLGQHMRPIFLLDRHQAGIHRRRRKSELRRSQRPEVYISLFSIHTYFACCNLLAALIEHIKNYPPNLSTLLHIGVVWKNRAIHIKKKKTVPTFQHLHNLNASCLLACRN